MPAKQTATRAKPGNGRPASRAVAVQEREENVSVSKTAPGGAIAERYSSGRGLSKSQSDNMIPLIYVLQAQSPQVLKKNPSYIPGAEAGDIWLRNAADPIVKGDEGMLFQPCAFYKEWVEWVPRDDGGGFVGRFPCRTVEDESRPPVNDAKEQVDEENPQAVKWVRKNGNELVFTRYHIGFVIRGNLPLPFVIPLTSTGHTFSKQWMFLMNSQQLPNGRIPDSYASAYRLKVVPKSNKKGDWFAYDVQWEGWLNEAQIAKGAILAAAFESGEKEIEVPEQADVKGAADDNM
jgi:hypothetical protein